MSDFSNAPAASPPSDEHDALPAGTRFGELEILRVVGVGGFGIVYLARDHSLDRDVALKEYMPGQLAARGPSAQVSVRSGSHMETFALGLRSFVNEARLLARFDHRSLVKVYRFWEANNTAYMVMPFLQGRTLREARRAMNQAPDEAWMRQILNPLLEALEILHRETVYHRDIAPDNILLPHDGSQPVLLDFGAARRAIGDRTQTFTAILKPSYAPIEQYAESVSLRQGPWTDLYAMGAVLHYLLKGVPPPPATARTFEDHSEVLAELSFPGVSRGFLAAVDWALAVRPQDRPQSVVEFRDALNGKTTPPVVARKPPPAAPSHDAFVRTAADPARPAVAGFTSAAGLPFTPAAGGEATVIDWPTQADVPTVPAPRTAVDAPATGQALGDPTAPFKPVAPAQAPSNQAWAPQGLPAQATQQAAVPGIRNPVRQPPVEAAARRPRVAAAAGASVLSRLWPWSLPVLLLMVAAAAWWMKSNKADTTGAVPPATAAGVSAPAADPAVPSAAPQAVAPAPKEQPAIAVTPQDSTPAIPAVVTAAPAPAAPAAPPAPQATAAAAANKPPAQPAAPTANARANPRGDGAAANTASTSVANPRDPNSGAAPRIVLEPRQPRGQANDAARNGDNQGQPRTAATPMWPPVPQQPTEEPKPKPTATARAPDPVPDSPNQICGPRSFIIRLACMERECRTSRFASHPHCAEIRAREDMRQQGNIYGGNR